MSKESAKGRGAGLHEYFYSKDARQDSRKDGDSRSWTRDRKLPLPNLLIGILDQAGLTGAMEIRRIFKAEGKDPDEAVSNQDYLARRRLLNPKIFRVSNRIYLKPFYEGEEAKTWNGYLALAADGSKFEVSNSKENKERYGRIGKGPESSVSRCLYSALSDVLNGFILHITIGSVSGNEIEEAEKNIKESREVTGKRPVVVIFDRNYPSLQLIHFLEKLRIKYVIRLKSKDYKAEMAIAGEGNENIEIVHTRMRIYEMKKKYPEEAEELAGEKSTRARVIKLRFKDGDGFLLTNLEDTITSESIGNLYRRRWAVEERFNTLKNKMKGEYTAGKSASYVEQDFWASVVVHNIIEDLLNQANPEVADAGEKKGLKYKMHVNESIAIGHFKDQFVSLALEADDQQRGRLFDKLLSDIEAYTLPYRSTPSKPRRWNPVNKYKCNQKPSY
jgi:hypothetical protein